MSAANVKFFEVEVDGKVWKLKAMRPKGATLVEAKRIYTKKNTQLFLSREAVPRDRIFEIMKEIGEWTDADDKKRDEFMSELSRLETVLSKGVGAELNDEEKEIVKDKGWKEFGKETALKLFRLRMEFLVHVSKAAKHDNITMENICEDEMIGYLTSQCVRWAQNEGIPDSQVNTFYFSNYDDYLARQDDPDARVARAEFETFYKGLTEDWRANLLEYKFMNDEYQMVDKDGKPVQEATEAVEDALEVGNFEEEAPVAEVEAAPIVEGSV
jgi:hypothetical protein